MLLKLIELKLIRKKIRIIVWIEINCFFDKLKNTFLFPFIFTYYKFNAVINNNVNILNVNCKQICKIIENEFGQSMVVMYITHIKKQMRKSKF